MSKPARDLTPVVPKKHRNLFLLSSLLLIIVGLMGPLASFEGDAEINHHLALYLSPIQNILVAVLPQLAPSMMLQVGLPASIVIAILLVQYCGKRCAMATGLSCAVASFAGQLYSPLEGNLLLAAGYLRMGAMIILLIAATSAIMELGPRKTAAKRLMLGFTLPIMGLLPLSFAALYLRGMELDWVNHSIGLLLCALAIPMLLKPSASLEEYCTLDTAPNSLQSIIYPLTLIAALVLFTRCFEIAEDSTNMMYYTSEYYPNHLLGILPATLIICFVAIALLKSKSEQSLIRIVGGLCVIFTLAAILIADRYNIFEVVDGQSVSSVSFSIIPASLLLGALYPLIILFIARITRTMRCPSCTVALCLGIAATVAHII